MKRVYTTILGSCLLLFTTWQTQAQESDTAIATRNAMKFAESFVKAHFYQDWKTYTELTNPTAIKYYGGAQQFKEHVVTIYFRNEPKLEEKPEAIRVIEMRNDIDQWQCVIEKVRNTFINDKKAVITSYLVGQSNDAGQTWKFVDVSHNAIENFSLIFPPVFGDLPIPSGKVEYPGEIVAEPVVEAPKATAKKKATKKR
ncbi:MAG: hypothetical protein J7621_16620 [Niastella sp.]|nr:hypothetical protein [Niastella sp.]